MLANDTFLWGATAKAQKSLLDDRRIAKSLPPLSVDPPQQSSNATGLVQTDPARTELAV